MSMFQATTDHFGQLSVVGVGIVVTKGGGWLQHVVEDVAGEDETFL